MSQTTKQPRLANNTCAVHHAVRAYGGDMVLLGLLITLHAIMLISGFAEDATELRHLLVDGAAYEAPLVSLYSFIAYPVISCQLLVGLCWLLFVAMRSKRMGIVTRKSALSLVSRLGSQVTLSAHSCRAPPAL